MEFKVESFDKALPLIQPLWKDHWIEVGVDHEVTPLDVNIDEYSRLCSLGFMKIILAYSQEEVVGYMVWMVRKHIRYQQSLIGVADVFWMKPEYRNLHNGSEMFKFAEAYLKTLGVVKITAGCKIEHPLDHLFLSLGYYPVEMIFTKVLKE